jgi:hypothetical protein
MNFFPKEIFRASVMFFLFCLIAAFGPNCVWAQSSPTDMSACDLAKDPSAYDGK